MDMSSLKRQRSLGAEKSCRLVVKTSWLLKLFWQAVGVFPLGTDRGGTDWGAERQRGLEMRAKLRNSPFKLFSHFFPHSTTINIVNCGKIQKLKKQTRIPRSPIPQRCSLFILCYICEKQRKDEQWNLVLKDNQKMTYLIISYFPLMCHFLNSAIIQKKIFFLL